MFFIHFMIYILIFLSFLVILDLILGFEQYERYDHNYEKEIVFWYQFKDVQEY